MRYLSLLSILSAVAAYAQPLLLQRPTINRTHIVFAYAGDLWSVPREGGNAIRLTSGPGVENDAFFSPDGTQIAFTGEYDGNVDVYVMAATGGVPKRLTYHPSVEEAAGWTPDGKQVLFRSPRASYSNFRKLYTVPVEGGEAKDLPLPMSSAGSYSADGSQIAYMPWGFLRPPNSYDAWKNYRGGRATPVWIAKLSDSSIVKLPRTDSNDSHPMWVGDTVYFLSDRNGPVTLFSYDVKSKQVQQLIENKGLDVKWASAGPGAIVYEQFGGILLYDLKSKKSREVPVKLAGDLPEVRPYYEKISRHIRSASISPSGVRAVLEARGEIVTVPLEKGDARNLTRTPAAHERAPEWSPDGKWIAYFSDADGEYALHVVAQNGSGEVKKIKPEGDPGFYVLNAWSPDSKKLLYTDNRLNAWYAELESGKCVKVATDTYYDPMGMQFLDPSWAPDSKWIAYTKQLKNRLRAVWVYSLETGKAAQITDGMSDARNAVFDQDGKHLYFTASTDSAPTSGWLDLSTTNRPVSRSVYVAVLRKEDPSPLAPESDEEKPQDAKKPEEKKDAKVEVRIDVENIGQRILALPMPSRNYTGLWAGKKGVLFVREEHVISGRFGEPALHKFELSKRKPEKFVDAPGLVTVSANGEKLLYSKGQQYFLVPTGAPPKPGDGALKTDAVEVQVDPRAEWKQMYSEVWRIQRDYFYDANLHGFEWQALSKKYAPYLDGVASRSDLNYLFTEMLSPISVGHLYIRGGAVAEAKRVKGGLLGADFRVENGRYRFARVFSGENWNPQLRAPLTQPGVNVAAGDYLLAVNGRDVQPSVEVHAYLEGTAGKSTVLKVAADASGTNAREVTVIPLETEQPLRYNAWIEDNRRKVDQMTNGRVAYVHLPDTAEGGLTNFNRYYFAQVDREGVVVDERFNGGGLAADYVVDYLRRPLLNYWTTRYGEDFVTPYGSIFGPKAMIVNEFAGSGGDAMPWYFRRLKIGPLVGKRTWGGLVGILGFPVLMDGGTVTAPNVAFYNPEGEWDVENHGVAPDIEVELDPQLVRQGRDPQLEKAVEYVMEELKKNPLPRGKKPAYPNYNRSRERERAPATGGGGSQR